ncbi:MAG: hypothetical protein EOO44_18240 [Flavobacterium sp.]|nr:MAG: hypothetical protein EOO44_18240 [Flavobacterium sp.]
MKKILCLFGAMTLLLSSCSSNDDYSPEEENDDNGNNNPGTETVFLKKTIITDSEGDKVTSIYSYNGNKIVSIVDDSGESNAYYTYTGDLITKLEYKLPDGTIEQVNTYAYDSKGRLVDFVRIDPVYDLGNREVYTYSADGSINYTEYIGDATTQDQENSTGTVKFSNGEVIEMTNTVNDDHSYTYDTKNNPLKNVLGWEKICFTDSEANDVLHNMLTDKTGDEVWYSYTYTYNDAGFPTKSVESVEKETSEFFY